MPTAFRLMEELWLSIVFSPMDLKAFPCVASGTINSRNGEIATVAVGGDFDGHKY